MVLSDSQSDTRNPIAAYARTQSPELRAICDKLQAEIARAIPSSTCKIWHASPVWFIGENPVVGYGVRQKRVDLMFWSGQLFDEPRLKAVGKDRAAQVSIQNESDINLPELRRWLQKAGTIVFDYVATYRRKRETSRLKPKKLA